MKTTRLGLILASCALLTACSGSRVSAVKNGNPPAHAIRAIAFAPGGGLMADAVGVELANRGYVVIDTAQVTGIIGRIGLNEIELQQPAGLQAMREQGIDALLSVRSASGPDGTPQSASARMTSTHTGQVISGATWQNGWGGMQGSIADRVMRQDLGEAAEKIADSLTASLK